MRYFFRCRIPEFSRVLLIESGARHLLENFLPGFYAEHPAAAADLVTCYDGHPAAFRPGTGSVYRVTDYPDSPSRRRFLDQLAANRYTIAVAICSGEPIMAKWKWMLCARLPVKVLILNENGDYVWVDYSNWRILKHFVLFRAGLSGAGAVTTLGRLAAFPFTLTYLVLYTAVVHLRRKAHS